MSSSPTESGDMSDEDDEHSALPSAYAIRVFGKLQVARHLVREEERKRLPFELRVKEKEALNLKELKSIPPPRRRKRKKTWNPDDEMRLMEEMAMQQQEKKNQKEEDNEEEGDTLPFRSKYLSAKENKVLRSTMMHTVGSVKQHLQNQWQKMRHNMDCSGVFPHEWNQLRARSMFRVDLKKSLNVTALQEEITYDILDRKPEAVAYLDQLGLSPRFPPPTADSVKTSAPSENADMIYATPRLHPPKTKVLPRLTRDVVKKNWIEIAEREAEKNNIGPSKQWRQKRGRQKEIDEGLAPIDEFKADQRTSSTSPQKSRKEALTPKTPKTPKKMGQTPRTPRRHRTTESRTTTNSGRKQDSRGSMYSSKSYSRGSPTKAVVDSALPTEIDEGRVSTTTSLAEAGPKSVLELAFELSQAEPEEEEEVQQGPSAEEIAAEKEKRWRAARERRKEKARNMTIAEKLAEIYARLKPDDFEMKYPVQVTRRSDYELAQPMVRTLEDACTILMGQPDWLEKDQLRHLETGGASDFIEQDEPEAPSTSHSERPMYGYGDTGSLAMWVGGSEDTVTPPRTPRGNTASMSARPFTGKTESSWRILTTAGSSTSRPGTGKSMLQRPPTNRTDSLAGDMPAVPPSAGTMMTVTTERQVAYRYLSHKLHATEYIFETYPPLTIEDPPKKERNFFDRIFRPTFCYEKLQDQRDIQKAQSWIPWTLMKFTYGLESHSLKYPIKLDTRSFFALTGSEIQERQKDFLRSAPVWKNPELWDNSDFVNKSLDTIVFPWPRRRDRKAKLMKQTTKSKTIKGLKHYQSTLDMAFPERQLDVEEEFEVTCPRINRQIRLDRVWRALQPPLLIKAKIAAKFQHDDLGKGDKRHRRDKVLSWWEELSRLIPARESRIDFFNENQGKAAIFEAATLYLQIMHNTAYIQSVMDKILVETNDRVYYQGKDYEKKLLSDMESMEANRQTLNVAIPGPKRIPKAKGWIVARIRYEEGELSQSAMNKDDEEEEPPKPEGFDDDELFPDGTRKFAKKK